MKVAGGALPAARPTGAGSAGKQNPDEPGASSGGPPQRTERPRERLLADGPGALGTAELIALLLGAGTRGRPVEQVADALLGEAGGLRGLSARSAEELAALPGVGSARAARVIASVELGRRFATEPLTRGAAFRSSRDIFRHYHARLRDLTFERFLTVLLDGKHRVLRDLLISQGTLTSSPVHPREVFRPAIRHGAAAIVLVHNHPSGDPSPSADDLEITRRLADVGELVGIRVIDHVVIGDGSYVSLADRGLLR